MGTYDKQFKEEAVRLSDEVGVKKAAQQLGIPYYTLADWRSQRKQRGDQLSQKLIITLRTWTPRQQ